MKSQFASPAVGTCTTNELKYFHLRLLKGGSLMEVHLYHRFTIGI
ncbi:MAG TPA: hypothetical protein VLX91_08970 [Candidatus Acidoferrales bacterium]|nr:hypothetical protein [Candidatus Acidoferrales bacterium]